MSDDTTQDDKGKTNRHNISLTEISVKKIERWFEQINSKKKIKISKKDLINWFIEGQPDNLPNSELNALIDHFYDEEKFLKQLLLDVRKAKSIGITDNLEVVVRPKKLENKKETTDPAP